MSSPPYQARWLKGRRCWKCNIKTSGQYFGTSWQRICALLSSCLYHFPFYIWLSKDVLIAQELCTLSLDTDSALFWSVWDRKWHFNLTWKWQITIIQLCSFEVGTLQYVFSIYCMYSTLQLQANDDDTGNVSKVTVF